MTQIWKNNPVLSINFEPLGLRRASCEPLQLFEYFWQHGFTLCEGAGSKGRPIGDFDAFCSAIEGEKQAEVLAVRA